MMEYIKLIGAVLVVLAGAGFGACPVHKMKERTKEFEALYFCLLRLRSEISHGGSTVAHQFSRIGKHAMVGGGSKINKDVPPYVLCGRDPLTYAGVNIVGLRRRGFSSEQIRNIKDMYDIVYGGGMNTTDALARIESGFPQSEERDTILDFIRNSKRGIIKGFSSTSKGDQE